MVTNSSNMLERCSFGLPLCSRVLLLHEHCSAQEHWPPCAYEPSNVDLLGPPEQELKQGLSIELQRHKQ
jgi:hypothetical protein